MFWGLSSALDLYDEYLKAFRINDDTGKEGSNAGGDGPTSPAKLNILLLGEADARHVIRTLAKRYTHRVKPDIHIYIVEGSPEIEARHMLLLAVALEDPASFNLVSKAHLYMDLYGNTMVRPSTYHYMASKGRTLLKMVTNEEQLQSLAPMLNIQHLKYRERDGLEMAFTFWQPQPQHVYKITEYWEQRGRALMGTRYDHRNGVFDWDLNMTLKNRGGQQICSQEYRYWRESGVAFVFPEYEHCKPNKTFCAGLVRDGTTFMHRGYVGEMQTGPFCGFGLRSAEERMHNSAHGENDYRATDITERNLLEFFHELQTQEPYEHDATRSRRYGSVQLLMSPLLSHEEEDISSVTSYQRPWIKVPGVTVHYLSSLVIPQMQSGVEYWNSMFDVVFVAYNYNVFLKNPSFLHILKPQGLFIHETMQMTVNRKDVVKEFESKAKKFMKEGGLKPVLNYNAINSKNMILKFKKNRFDDGNEADEEEEEEKEEDSEEANGVGENWDLKISEVENEIEAVDEPLPKDDTKPTMQINEKEETSPNPNPKEDKIATDRKIIAIENSTQDAIEEKRKDNLENYAQKDEEGTKDATNPVSEELPFKKKFFFDDERWRSVTKRIKELARPLPKSVPREDPQVVVPEVPKGEEFKNESENPVKTEDTIDNTKTGVSNGVQNTDAVSSDDLKVPSSNPDLEVLSSDPDLEEFLRLENESCCQ
ncbi:dynein axonemal assembly factor 3 homolog [Drosophila bipectinata]|uniref:dynein axonemal assembly factor 3 homolog n=1 Tax=Drosophila bipectinata TaxID=42026 RepID=UPI001C89CD91|nr:dynein axonemal assembly factor 3 homolog [Drosophila bipectinata]